MIAFGNNIYRTLNDKFYLGTQQIGKVYKGTDLIYPEEIDIKGIKIDTSFNSLNGNIFDLGYVPTKNTRFECCFYLDVANKSRAFFGTSHDNKFVPKYRYYNNNGSQGNSVGNSSEYTNYDVKVKIGSNTTYSTIEKNSTSWNDLVANNTRGYANYKNETKFHVIYGTNSFSFRYGGQQDASSGENTRGFNLGAGKPCVIGFDDFSSTEKWYTGSGFLGKYYFELNGENVPSDVTTMLNNASKITTTFSTTDSGGNLWLNAINREIPNPNVRRPYANNSFDDDLIYYNESGNIGFVYMIIWESGNNPKTLYTQHKNSAAAGDVVIYKYVQISDGQGGYKFRDADPITGEVSIDEIIYPFYRFIPE